MKQPDLLCLRVAGPLAIGSQSYLMINSDGSLSSGALSHGPQLVHRLSRLLLILTEIWQKKEGSDEYLNKVVALTLSDENEVSMTGAITDDSKKTQQQWIAECVGDVSYDPDHSDLLKSARLKVCASREHTSQLYYCRNMEA